MAWQVERAVSPLSALDIDDFEGQAQVAEAKTLVNVSAIRNPFLGKSIDELLDLP